MQRNNAKDDAVEGGPVRLRPRASSRQASSQPRTPAAGHSPPRPAGKIIPQFDPLWRRTIPETYAAFAKAAAVLEATPMPKPKRMPRRPHEPPNRRITHHQTATEVINTFPSMGSASMESPWSLPHHPDPALKFHLRLAPSMFISTRQGGG